MQLILKNLGMILLILFTMIASTGWAFDVISVSPAQNESNVPTLPLITVTFDQDIDLQSVGDSSFIVYAKTTGFCQGEFSYNSSSMTLLFEPDEAFKVGDLVTVSLTKKIKSVSGEPLDTSFVWQFRTKVSSSSPGQFVFDTLYYDEGAFTLFPADLDGDGDIDFATSNRDVDSISIFLNDGLGKFHLHSRCETNDGPYTISGGDFDADGDIDLTTSNYQTHDVSILTNDGNAFFSHTADLKTGLYPYLQAITDFDGDGDLDICVANASQSYISIFENNGDGTFGEASNYTCPFAPFSVDASDFDNDGDIDIVETSRFSDPNSFSILSNNADGAFEVVFTSIVEYLPVYVAGGDFDLDKNVDLVINSGGHTVIYKNSGDWDFILDSSYYNIRMAGFAYVADLNGDGNIDVVSHNGSHLEVLYNNSAGIFSENMKIARDYHLEYMAAVDIDSDGDLDLLSRNTTTNIAVLLNEAYLCGDANGNGLVNIEDAVYLINYVFLSSTAPVPYEAGDADCGGNVNVSDAVYLINYIFMDSDAPCDVTLFDLYNCLY